MYSRSDGRTPVRRLFNRAISSFLFGIDAATWKRLLRENRFSVDPEFWPRALVISLMSAYNSRHLSRENARFGALVARTKLDPPLFILGHWRSGTSHLHRLLSLDERFAYPNFYQASYPNTFLSTEVSHTRLTSRFLPKTRPMDGMLVSYRTPAEDDLALSLLTGYSTRLGWVFPRNMRHYERYLTFQGVSSEEVAYWKGALEWFLKKLSWKDGRPLVLKSPEHTARIGVLLDMFPTARFVHIHRNPYAVFQSSCNQLVVNGEFHRLQRKPRERLSDIVLRRHVQMYNAFFEQRSLIPDGHLHEVAFEDLERDPLGEVNTMYQRLGLPGFARVESRMAAYLASLGAYEKNSYRPMPESIRRGIATAWRRSFDEWGYGTGA